MTSTSEFLAGISAISCAQRVYAAQEPTWDDWPASLSPQLVQALGEIGAARPYAHQVQTIEAAMRGQDVALVTGTASGKTLSFVVPAFEAMLRNPNATTLLLYPTKALSWDQYGSTQRLKDTLGDAAANIRIEKYDGDMLPREKTKVRTKGANFLLTNPDELHSAILQYHHLWRNFLANLRYIVIDEVHACSGFFGSNVALVLRRLLALCRRYGTSPTCIAASATILNARDLVEKMIGRPVVLVDGDTAGSATKHVVIVDADDQYEPDDHPDGEPEDRKKKSPEALTLELVAQATDAGMRGIVFANSRQTAEDLVAKANKLLPQDMAARIAVYRSGLAADVRRRVEADLKHGDLAFVVSTNALELGIDIGELDVCILYGVPQTKAEVWQRLGRVGRKRDRESVGIVVALKSIPDIEGLANPGSLFDGRNNPESVVINPDNTELKRLHDACAEYETVEDGMPAQCTPADDLERNRFRTYGAARLRDIRGSWELVVENGAGRETIGVIDAGAAPREAYQGAVYIHGAQSYRVAKWEPNRGHREHGTIVLHPETDASLRTTPLRSNRFSVGHGSTMLAFHSLPYAARLLLGDIEVNARTVGYFEFDGDTGKSKRHSLKSSVGLYLKSRGIGLTLDGVYSDFIEEILRAVGNLIAIHVMRRLSCDRSDLHIHATGYCWDLDAPALFIVESHAGNLGYADAAFEDPATLLRAALWIAKVCKCRDGCSRCIYAAGTRRPVHEINIKAQVVDILQKLADGGLTPSLWVLPRTPTRPARDEEVAIGSEYVNCGIVVDNDEDGFTIQRPSGHLVLVPWEDIDIAAVTDDNLVLRAACRLFRLKLERQQRVTDYLSQRGIRWRQLQSDFDIGGNDLPLDALSGYMQFYPNAIDLLIGGVISKRSTVLRPAVVAPLRDEARALVGVQLRRCEDKKPPSYVTHFRDPKKKEEYLYGLHLDATRLAAAKEGLVVVCKGVFDCWACHQDQHHNAVATLDDGISKTQLARVKQLGVKEIVLGFTSEKEIGIAWALARGDLDLVVSRIDSDHDLDEAPKGTCSIAEIIAKRVEILDATDREEGIARARQSYEALKAEIDAKRYFIFPVDRLNTMKGRTLITALEKERRRKRKRKLKRKGGHARVAHYIKVPNRFVDDGLHRAAGTALQLLLHLYRTKKKAGPLPVSIKVESLAKKLGVSESIINKHAQRLRILGLLISVIHSKKSPKHAWDWYPVFVPVK